MLARSYLRASTSEQDASRAREMVEAFATDHALMIAGTYIENESGARLARPELFRLLADSKPGDVILVEQVDRLSRLTASDWMRLRAEIELRLLRVVALDLPTSWLLTKSADEFTERMFAAINAMLLDMLAAVARKDYDDRRRRQAQGQSLAKAAGKYRGRSANVARNGGILSMLKGGASWSEVQAATGCSRAHIAKLVKMESSDQREGTDHNT